PRRYRALPGAWVTRRGWPLPATAQARGLPVVAAGSACGSSRRPVTGSGAATFAGRAATPAGEENEMGLFGVFAKACENEALMAQQAYERGDAQRGREHEERLQELQQELQAKKG